MTIFNRERANAYSHFRDGCNVAPDGTFEHSRMLLTIISDTCNFLEQETAAIFVKTDKGDAFYELEAHMFDMIRRANPDSEIESCIGLGKAMEEGTPETRGRVLGGLIRDRNYIAAMNEEALKI